MQRNGFVELKYDRTISQNKSISLRGYYDHYYFKGGYPYLREFDVNGELESGGLFVEKDLADWLGSEVKFIWDISIANRIIAGAEYQNHINAELDLIEENETFFKSNFPFKTYDVFIQDEYQVLNSLRFILGIRWNKFRTFESSYTPRGAIIYRPFPKTSLKLLYGQAYRAPSIWESNADDGEFIPNSELEPEKITTNEIIWEQQLGNSLFGTISFFDYHVDKLIEQKDIIIDQDILAQFQNIDKANARGFEIEIKSHYRSNLNGYLNYSFNDSEDDANARLTNSPKHLVKIGLNLSVLTYFKTAMEMQYESKRITGDEDGLIKTDDFFITNVYFSTNPRPKGQTGLARVLRHIKPSLFINNVFDVDYQHPGGPDHEQLAIAQNGRNFRFKLNYQF